MKRLFALLLCLCMALSLAACGGSNNGAAAPESSAEGSGEVLPDVSGTAEGSAQGTVTGPAVETGEPNVTLDKVVGDVKGDDGTVLVTYDYQKATVTLPDANAMVAVQSDLDDELQIFLDSVNGELTDYARDASAYSKEAESSGSDSYIYEFQPYYSQYTVTVSRADESVISLVIDSVGYSGGAHGWDNRYTLNYDSKTGQRLTFETLGANFRKKAEELVLAQAEKSKDQLDEDYANQLPLVVADGTESLAEVNRQLYPELYEDTSIEPETGNLNAQFYLSGEGVSFIAGEYVMKPYAGGILEFTVPYEQFGDALNQSYVPQGYQPKSEKQEEKNKKEKKTDKKADEADASASGENK